MFNYIFIESICIMCKITICLQPHISICITSHVLEKCPQRTGNEEKLKGFYKRKSLIWGWFQRPLLSLTFPFSSFTIFMYDLIIVSIYRWSGFSNLKEYPYTHITYSFDDCYQSKIRQKISKIWKFFVKIMLTTREILTE